ncbi:MAG: hypothetical protein EZS28_015345 [Streblomastix strix]|nr:MAG: hypothetical protein EZS28_015345 [Streblomastix strix]
MFQNTCKTAAIGIVRDSYDIPTCTHPGNKPHCNHIAVQWNDNHNGNIYYNLNITIGNKGFKDNQIVKLEFDSEKGTLFFFIDNVQQPVYFSGIKEKVRFIIFIQSTGSSCTIKSLKKLREPTSVHLENEKAVKW